MLTCFFASMRTRVNPTDLSFKKAGGGAMLVSHGSFGFMVSKPSSRLARDSVSKEQVENG